MRCLILHSNSISTKSLGMRASRIEKSWLMASAQGIDERAGNHKGKKERDRQRDRDRERRESNGRR